jgi:hypothetical protein
MLQADRETELDVCVLVTRAVAMVVVCSITRVELGRWGSAATAAR